MACYVVDMRVLILLLLLSMGFSSFSTAAHAFDSPDCGSIVSEEINSSKMQCPDHAGKSDKQDDTSQDGKHVCMSCGHCCVSHASFPQLNIHIALPPVAKTFFVFTDANVDDDFVSGLKRPPKSLV